MPALPPGRNDPSGQQESGTRAIRVFNIDDLDAPPFAALEIAGWDIDRRAFRVRRCTVTGRNDLMFNGISTIPSRMEGQAWGDKQHIAGFRPDEGANPVAGEVWGVKAGEWLLSPNYPGYSILDTTTASRGYCVVQLQRSNITEFLRVTNTVNPDLDLPDDWVEAELVFHDPVTDEWGTTSPTTPVYFRDIYNRKGYYAVKNGTQGPCYVHVTRTGFREGLPVYVGNENCSTTTTTLAPCLGACDWDWNPTTKRWVLDANTCDPSSSCKCLAPTFCPPDDGEAYCTQTRCGRISSHQSGPNCTGTTTTASPSCPTTNAPSCSKTCEFFSHPVLGWVKTEDNCPFTCPCPYPSGGTGACETATTSCQVIPVVCGGGCRFTWVTPPEGEPYWYQYGEFCFQSGFPPNCYCDQPAEAGSSCGQVLETPCYIHGAGGGGSGGGCECCDHTTTTAAPGTCGRCLWGTDDGEAWENRRNCPGCMCLEPDSDPTGECDLRETVCFTTTTTGGPTTTTIAPTTTVGPTTTTASPTTVAPTTTASPCVCCGGSNTSDIQVSITGPFGPSCGSVTNYVFTIPYFPGLGVDIWEGTYAAPGGPTGLIQIKCTPTGWKFSGFIDGECGYPCGFYFGDLTGGGIGVPMTGGPVVIGSGPCAGATMSLSVEHPCPNGTYCPTTTTGEPTTTGGPVLCGMEDEQNTACSFLCQGGQWVLQGGGFNACVIYGTCCCLCPGSPCTPELENAQANTYCTYRSGNQCEDNGTYCTGGGTTSSPPPLTTSISSDSPTLGPEEVFK